MDETKTYGSAADPGQRRERWARRRKRLKQLVDSGDYEINRDVIAEHMVDRFARLFESDEGSLALI